MTSLTDDDRAAIEQQLTILLEAAPTMGEFPSEEAADHCIALGVPPCLRYAFGLSGRTVSLAEALRLVSTRFGPREDQPAWPYDFLMREPNPHLTQCIGAAHEYFLAHMSTDQARMFYEAMTGDVRKTLPIRPDLRLMVRCGLRMGLPEEVGSFVRVVQILTPGKTSFTLTPRIKIGDAVNICMGHLQSLEVAGDQLYLEKDYYRLTNLGAVGFPCFNSYRTGGKLWARFCPTSHLPPRHQSRPVHPHDGAAFPFSNFFYLTKDKTAQ
jgi:hypothetical protein